MKTLWPCAGNSSARNNPFYLRSPYAAAKLYAYWITINYTGQILIEIDPRYFRPAEVGILVDDASKSRKKLG